MIWFKEPTPNTKTLKNPLIQRLLATSPLIEGYVKLRDVIDIVSDHYQLPRLVNLHTLTMIDATDQTMVSQNEN